MPDLLDIAQAAVQAAMSSGAEWADAAVTSGRSVGVMVENSSLTECEVVRDCGIGVRAFHRGGMGSSTTTMLDEASARQTGEQSAAMAKATHGDPDFVALPAPAKFDEVPGRWDDAVAGLPADQVVQWCQMAIEEAKDVAGDVALSGGAGLDCTQRALASSTGVAVASRGTNVSASFFAVVARQDDVGSYFEYDAARQLTQFEPEGIGRKATLEALRFMGARHIESGRMAILLGPMAVCSMLSATISAANAEGVQRNRSFMIGKEGLSIAAEGLTVREEPFVPAGLSSAAVDGEGVPKKARALIDHGVLTTYLHNSYTANKAKVENTAHAVRGGSSPSVSIGTANLQVDRGGLTEAELIAQIDDGLYISYGGLEPDSSTGDVSATVDFGFRIQNGELVYPVKTTMIGSNIFELLQAIDAVSSDYREEPGIIVPSLRIGDVMVIGGA